MREFPRIKGLPPYVFATINELKLKARREGEDIIDLGMGNPDLPTPKHIVNRLIESSQKSQNHRYSASRGITKLRMAISSWYKRRCNVDVDPEEEVLVTIGSKEGLAHLVLAIIEPGDVVLVPSPTYPIHSYSLIIAVGNKEMIFALRRIKSYLDYGVFQPVQIASITALSGWQKYVEDVAGIYNL